MRLKMIKNLNLTLFLMCYLFSFQVFGNNGSPKTDVNQNFILSTKEVAQNNSDSVYLIPIVFHVLYHNPVDNISDAQIMDGLAELNQRFRKQNADTIDIIAPFVPLAASASIEFRLAQTGPDGNPTAGITRTYTDSLAFDNLWDAYTDSTGGVHTWPTHKYLNIHVVKEFAHIVGGGRGTLPSDLFPERQGIIITHNMIGSIGTGSGATVFTHEVGHFFSLYHLWAYLGTPGDTANCNHDDGVADTPNCFGASYYYGTPSGLWAESCGSLDNVQNYMDYSPSGIRNMFTAGQVARMHSALNSPIGGRSNLHTPDNQMATGIFNPNSIAEEIENQIQVYPNPAQKILHVSSQDEAIQTVRIFHILGEEVLYISGIRSFFCTLAIDNLTAGLYVVKVNEIHIQMLVVQ